jgi:hypothetical protein
MGEKNLVSAMVYADELISQKLFTSIQALYNTPDTVLPRVRRNGKIIRPLRFYRADVERLFSKPLSTPTEPGRSLKTETTREPLKIARPSIQFKRRRR